MCRQVRFDIADGGIDRALVFLGRLDKNRSVVFSIKVKDFFRMPVRVPLAGQAQRIISLKHFYKWSPVGIHGVDYVRQWVMLRMAATTVIPRTASLSPASRSF